MINNFDNLSNKIGVEEVAALVATKRGILIDTQRVTEKGWVLAQSLGLPVLLKAGQKHDMLIRIDENGEPDGEFAGAFDISDDLSTTFLDIKLRAFIHPQYEFASIPNSFVTIASAISTYGEITIVLSPLLTANDMEAMETANQIFDGARKINIVTNVREVSDDAEVVIIVASHSEDENTTDDIFSFKKRAKAPLPKVFITDAQMIASMSNDVTEFRKKYQNTGQFVNIVSATDSEH